MTGNRAAVILDWESTRDWKRRAHEGVRAGVEHLAQEGRTMSIADGFAQASRAPALVNVHTAAGLGNAAADRQTSTVLEVPIAATVPPLL
jgi:thiamine pyrophosphate-dependent acetolactate synthase large subunit-like protein